MNSSSLTGHTMVVNILLVEDEERLAKNLKKGLTRQGYTVYYFSSAEDAELFLYKNHDVIELILLDSMLPGKNGVEMCKTLRSQGLTVPILMLTARDATEDIIISLDAGVDDYLTKPFSFEVLNARLRALVRRAQKAELISSELRVGQLSLDVAKRKVFYNNQEISLTLKEFNLLQYLMERPNTVLEREIILEKVWDINFDSFS
ncbi:MAG TPA: response regulator transcription factor, partial [Patescibacteria group bacterium]